MRQVSKIALLLAPVLIATSGCATKPSWVGTKPATQQNQQVAEGRTQRLLQVAKRYEESGKPDVALRLYQHIVEQDPQNVEAQEQIVALSQGHSRSSRSLAATQSSKKSSQYSRVTRTKPGQTPRTQTLRDSSDKLVAKNDAVPSQKTAEPAASKSNQLEDHVPAKERKEPLFEVAEREAPAQVPSEFAWADEPAAKEVEKVAENKEILDQFFEEVETSSEESVAQKSPQPEQKFGDELLASSEPRDEREWWGSVFSDETAEEKTKVEPATHPIAETETESKVIAETTEAAPETEQITQIEINPAKRSSQASEPVITVVKADTSSVETVFAETNSDWKTTSVQRLCDADASDELIQVVALLDSKEPTERIAGLIELGDQGLYARPASPAVRALLYDNDALVRAHAAGTVKDIEGTNADVVRHLKELLQEDDVNVLRLSAYLLGQMGSESQSTVAELQRLRDTKDTLTSLHASEALTRIIPEEMTSYEVLRKGLNDSSRENRLFSAVSLGCVSSHAAEFAAEALKDALKNEDPAVRATAALSLGGLGKHAEIAIEDLQQAADTDTPDVRDAALTALACLGK